MTRRNFVLGMSAFAAGGCRSLFTGAAADYDDDLTLFVADIHVSGTEPEYAYTQDRLRDFVAEVLRMDPLPRRIVFFGDLARFHGRREDYAVAVKMLQPIRDAGIELTMGMGNHDRHDFFFEFFPEYAKRTLVEGSMVSCVHLKDCDILMLDSLDVSAEGGRGGGALSLAQQSWLGRELPRWKRPVILCAHHDVYELKLNGAALSVLLVREMPMVKGYVCGHVHQWTCEWFHGHQWGGAHRVVRKASLPSLGYWGDIGWAEFRTTPERATLTLRQNDFFYARPVGFGEDGVRERPAVWDDIVESHRGANCTFRLKG